MKFALTVVETAPGELAVAKDPSYNPQEHFDFLKGLPDGDMPAEVIMSGQRTGKRRKVQWTTEVPKRRGRPKKD